MVIYCSSGEPDRQETSPTVGAKNEGVWTVAQIQLQLVRLARWLL